MTVAIGDDQWRNESDWRSKGVTVEMRRLLISLLTLATLAFPAHAVELDVDRPGLDYRNFEINQTNPGPCESACRREARCRAWTYVKPGIQGPRARCWLKSAIPEARTSACCISGIPGDDPQVAEIREVQSMLATLGFYPGRIDGKLGSQTGEAIRRFQARYNLIVNGRISPEVIKGLSGVVFDRDLKKPSTTDDAGTHASPAAKPAVPTGLAAPAKPAMPAKDLSDLNSLE